MKNRKIFCNSFRGHPFFSLALPVQLRLCAAGLGLGAFAVWLCYHSWLAFPAALLIGAGYVQMKTADCLQEEKRLLRNHFRDFLSALHTAQAAGYSLENGIRSAAEDMERLYGSGDILVRELREILRQMQFQKPAEQLLLELGERSGTEEIRAFGEVLAIGRRSGGNMRHVLERTWKNLCEKIDTEQEIDTVIAAQKYEQKLMSMMPAAIIVYLRFSFPGFLEKLYGNAAGAAVMTGCLALYLTAYLMGRRIACGEV